MQSYINKKIYLLEKLKFCKNKLYKSNKTIKN